MHGAATKLVAMRDGVPLATDIYLPDAGGPFPPLLERTPCGRHLPIRSEITARNSNPASGAAIAAFFANAGHAVVYQDCRGRYGSEGRFTEYLGEAEDGFDTACWLIRQPFGDGRIGTFGLSYAAHTQAALGARDPPGSSRRGSIAAASHMPGRAASASSGPSN